MGIREARREDIEAIRSTAAASWNRDYPDILSRESIAEGFDEWYGVDRLEAELDEPKTLVLVAERGDTVEGFVHAVVDGDTGVILRLYVHPDHRREGIGRVLFDSVRERFERYDVERVRAMTLSQNAAGRQFYEQLGFEKVSEGTTTIGGERYGEAVYELRRG